MEQNEIKEQSASKDETKRDAALINPSRYSQHVERPNRTHNRSRPMRFVPPRILRAPRHSRIPSHTGDRDADDVYRAQG